MKCEDAFPGRRHRTEGPPPQKSTPKKNNRRICLSSPPALLCKMANKREPDRKAVSALTGELNDAMQSGIILALGAVADRAGIFKLLAESSDAEGGVFLTEAAISTMGKLHPRYVREICGGLAAAGYLVYDAGADGYAMNATQAKVLADPNFALTFTGNFDILPAIYRAVEGVTQATMTPEKMTGVPFSEQAAWGFTRGMERMSPGVKSAYARKWLPEAMPEMVEKLKAGNMKVADLGCGAGVVATTLAETFPNADITGIDLNPLQIERANARHPGVKNLRFENRDLATVAPGTYDLIVNHDCIHDLVDPVGALKSVCQALKPNGIFFSMEPKITGESAKENYENAQKNNGRNKKIIAMGYGMSCLHCMTVSCAHGGIGLGSATFGPNTYEKLARDAGFTNFKIVGSNAVNNFYALSGGTGSSKL